MENTLSVIPLGGVGEIGLNMTVLEYNNDIIVIDAGLMFPEEDMLGVDFVIPDFSYLLDNREKIRGVILTHGHEDHTGALPFLLKEINVSVYGTPLTLGLVKEKLREHNLEHTKLVSVKPREVINLGVFSVEFIRVTHSIVDGVGLGITTPVGLVVHTGDFKLDPTPVDGQLMDFHRFSEYGERGTLLLLSDSTNAEKGGYTFSEKEVRRAFEDIFSNTQGRIIIATFASNIHRIQQAIDVAVKYGRKIILCGRSIVSNAQIALDLGYLRIPQNMWLRLEDLNKLKDHEVVIITTGSQGEPMSVLSRIATDEHKHIKIKDGDTVILSAKVIPGNERSIGKIINHLFRQGANVIYEKVSEVHVSGHASKEELKLMLNIVRPKYFMPVHGEYRHLVYHSMLAKKLDIPKENIFIFRDGDILEISAEGARKNGRVNSGRIFIDGKGIGDVGEMVLRDRLRLAHDGIVLILLGIEKLTGNIISGPEIISRGFVFEDASQEVINSVKELLSNTIKGLDKELISDSSLLKARLRSTLKKYLRDTMDRRPMILPIIFEV
ncbi:MAG: ribonuclease J [Nitrospirae bacterium CG_4_10_14_0_8_um_filter_41_23]|nr:ribonuclease J [Nitrospirota bacterium]OIP58783.1 MAG: ribonuclease J [Nitrospirae bacterium CG2_30_41_42]PIQ95060.1 MAG: ribonuclease J [Nitrospirae bacterium CG11_big_fil_rev_8_21_14_0_20_41_14]PIV41620.1 MAG: ribonuclease J [Nitrospirae bacterium CG02_land_8_20_14_3_00_41_53]PIW86668.1 MAG: ribonuclease J [Nitrospirae bacterium CG_4_8_14_3_um_filter_41_47]PIY86295.1 MAG: ribonuclease J [Nitrospirae bacterium CG_4_10_14_0_8_um_filter_41_23]PJA78840.1 MAG: ribonuclease J [Nitrospirae bact